jgi:hypothetical protein
MLVDPQKLFGLSIRAGGNALSHAGYLDCNLELHPRQSPQEREG